MEKFSYEKIKFIKVRSSKKCINTSIKNKNIPYQEFIINKKNEETLGELFSYFIMETVLIGKLLGINPFDQPAVEQVKF